MLRRFREQCSDYRFDGIHTLLLLFGALIGLWLLAAYSHTLGEQPLPAVLQSVVPWQNANVRPEPWERTLFLTGIILVPFCSLVLWFSIHLFFLQKKREWSLIMACVLVVFAAGGWIVTLSHSTPPPVIGLWEAWYTEPWKVLFPLTISSIVAMLLGITLLFFPRTWPRLSLPYPLLWECAFIALCVLFLSYDPLSLLQGVQTETSDDMWFIIPAWDILHGKYLFVESESQYGLLIFYMLAAVFRFIGTSVQSLKLVEMIVHAGYYTLVYVLVRSICKTRQGAIAAFLFILGGSIFRNELRFETYLEPSVTRLRNMWDIPVLLAMYAEYTSGKQRWFFAACGLAALASIYNTDIGLSLGLIMIGWSCVLPLFSDAPFSLQCKKIVMRIAISASCLFGAGLVFSLLTKIISGTWPNWSLNFYYTKLYLAGFGAMPMPVFGAYWAILGAEGVAIITACASWLLQRPLRNAPFLLTVGIYGLLIFQYYLNRSFIANLWVVSLPACLSGVMLVQAYLERCAHHDYRDSLCRKEIEWPLKILAGIFLGINLWIVGIGIPTLYARRYAPVQIAPTDPAFASEMSKSALAITSRIGKQDSVAVISPREAIFLLNADRSSAFHVPMLETVFTIEKMNTILSAFVSERHEYLFIEKNYARCPMCDAVSSALLPNYILETSQGFLDVYKRRD